MDLVAWYGDRYGIDPGLASLELWEIGYGDEVRIQAYESEGIAWEYRVEARSGDMLVVPVGTPEWELIHFGGP